MSVPVGLIWAQSEGGIIGSEGAMPWHLPEDLAHFTALTLDSPVIMGRKTWESLPKRFRPLPGRRNIVVTRQTEWCDNGAEVVHTIEEAIELASTSTTSTSTTSTSTTSTLATSTLATSDAHVWVIGGAQIYSQALNYAQRLEITEIRESFEGDTRAPVRGDQWMLAVREPVAGWHTSATGLHYRFLRYEVCDPNQR
ncbi:Dihydrofolate reductase [Leifsonia rubra CMS 76R]|nr:Dihydrofolate reductase [Leifsonia rubra CMS 76R]